MAFRWENSFSPFLLSAVGRFAVGIAIFLIGCSESGGLTGGIDAEIAAVSSLTATGGVEVVAVTSDVLRRIEDHPEKFQLRRRLETVILSSRLDETSPSDRIRSIGIFWKLACAASRVGANCGTDEESRRFRFRLEALKLYRKELDRAQSGTGTSWNDSSLGTAGMELRMRGYRSGLDYAFFQAVRDGFELGEFSTFFNRLSEGDKTTWKTELEKIAGRPVAIFNPEDPFAVMPSYDGFK